MRREHVLFLADTGGKGVFTQWVHDEFIVGSETIRPPNTHQVCGECFSKVPTQEPSGYFVKETLEFFHNSLPKVPIKHFVKEPPWFFHNSLSNVPIKNLSHLFRVLSKS